MRKNKDVIWEDSKQKEGFLVYSLLVFSIMLFIFIFITNWGSSESFISLIIAIIFTLVFILGLRLKYLSIEKKGLWTGNNTSGQFIDKLFILKQENLFLRWAKIDEITITEKLYAIGSAGGYKLYVVIRTKEGREYECLIVNKKGFIQALKKLNKYHLLDKKSRERYENPTNK